MPTNENSSGVLNCYVFKNLLHEYAQTMGLPKPVYETIKEGPTHQPSFTSTVIVNDVRYDSLSGFFNLKLAQQSAAEIALMELCKSGEVNESISQPVHETGFCKNLLQEYAEKMNYAMPVYHCQKGEGPDGVPHFWCKVGIGGIQYIGAIANDKIEAKIKAARTALQAIQSSTSGLFYMGVNNSQLTVIPCGKRAMETASNPDETVNVPKAKKARSKKKMLKTKLSGNTADHSQDKTTGNSAVGSDDLVKSEWVQTDSCTVLSSETLATNVMRNLCDTKIETDSSERMPSADVALAPQVSDNCKNGQLTAVNSIHSNHEAPDVENSSMVYDDPTDLVKLTDGEVASMVNDPTLSQMEASKIIPGLNQEVERIDQAVERIHGNTRQA